MSNQQTQAEIALQKAENAIDRQEGIKDALKRKLNRGFAPIQLDFERRNSHIWLRMELPRQTYQNPYRAHLLLLWRDMETVAETLHSYGYSLQSITVQNDNSVQVL